VVTPVISNGDVKLQNMVEIWGAWGSILKMASVKEIVADMKKILWIGIREENSLQPEICGFIYNAPLNSHWYNPNFTRNNAPLNSCWYNPNFTTKLEREINGLRDVHPESEFLLLGDMNSR
jgi:hypothetical protein